MNKPQDFDTVQGYGENVPLPAGGYVCKVMNVTETTSKKGDEMIVISLDIIEGDYADYFTDSYRNDNRPDKKWGCNMYQLTHDPVNKNSTNRGFKTFTTAVCDSNQGFELKWGNAFCANLKNRIVGCIFRREEYIGTDNNNHFSTKPYQFRGVDTIRNGKFKIPEDKLLDSENTSLPWENIPQNTAAKNVNITPDLSDFTEVISNDDLPF